MSDPRLLSFTVAVDNDPRERTFKLCDGQGGTIQIGRGCHNHIVLDHRCVSGDHIELKLVQSSDVQLGIRVVSANGAVLHIPNSAAKQKLLKGMEAIIPDEAQIFLPGKPKGDQKQVCLRIKLDGCHVQPELLDQKQAEPATNSHVQKTILLADAVVPDESKLEAPSSSDCFHNAKGRSTSPQKNLNQGTKSVNRKQRSISDSSGRFDANRQKRKKRSASKSKVRNRENKSQKCEHKRSSSRRNHHRCRSPKKPANRTSSKTRGSHKGSSPSKKKDPSASQSRYHRKKHKSDSPSQGNRRRHSTSRLERRDHSESQRRVRKRCRSNRRSYSNVRNKSSHRSKSRRECRGHSASQSKDRTSISHHKTSSTARKKSSRRSKSRRERRNHSKSRRRDRKRSRSNHRTAPNVRNESNRRSKNRRDHRDQSESQMRDSTEKRPVHKRNSDVARKLNHVDAGRESKIAGYQPTTNNHATNQRSSRSRSNAKSLAKMEIPRAADAPNGTSPSRASKQNTQVASEIKPSAQHKPRVDSHSHLQSASIDANMQAFALADAALSGHRAPTQSRSLEYRLGGDETHDADGLCRLCGEAICFCGVLRDCEKVSDRHGDMHVITSPIAFDRPEEPPVLLPQASDMGPPPNMFSHTLWEQPRDQLGLELIGEACSNSSVWDYVLRDDKRRSYAAFRQCPFKKKQPKQFFDAIKSGVEWKQPGAIPRKTAWMVTPGCQCNYRYGNVEVEPQEFPQWMTDVMQATMHFCGIKGRENWPDSCNINLYEDGGMSVAWHADDEQLFQGKFRDIRIISLSLGAKRQFELRSNWPAFGEKSCYSLKLGDGDLCTMEGMTQKHFQHRVPKEHRVRGSRINLTWRWILKHTSKCLVTRPR